MSSNNFMSAHLLSQVIIARPEIAEEFPIDKDLKNQEAKIFMCAK